MKKAINLYFCAKRTDEKLRLIKNAGYDGVLLGVNEKNETMTLAEQIELMKKLGLEISMIHCEYDESKLNHIWENSEIGDEVENELMRQIEKIKYFGENDSAEKVLKDNLVALNKLEDKINLHKEI